MQKGGKLAAATAIGALVGSSPFDATAHNDEVPVFDVIKYGALGDGKTLDTKAIQKAIDDATRTGKRARVRVTSGRKYLIGTIELKSYIDFHLEGDAELLVSTDKNDYTGEAAIIAKNANHLMISGTGEHKWESIGIHDAF